jgi:uncharacterized protein YjbJ (UPF0337 family)
MRPPSRVGFNLLRESPRRVSNDGSTLNHNVPILMKPSTTNITRGAGNIAAGKTKEIAGKAINRPKLTAKGKLQQAGGRIQKAVGKAQRSQGD